MKNVIVLSAVVLMATLSLTSCGKKEESATEPVATETPADTIATTETVVTEGDTVKTEVETTVKDAAATEAPAEKK